MSDTANLSGASIGFGELLGVLFIGLKLTGYIDWSWWYVTAPLWAPTLVLLAVAAILGVIYGVLKVFL